MHALRDRPVLALVTEGVYRQAIVQCAETIATSGNARLHLFEPACCGTSRAAVETATLGEEGLSVPGQWSSDAARRFAMNEERPALLVAGWPAARAPQGIPRFASSLNVPAVFVRWSPMATVDRVLIPTSGGPNTLRQLWIAREIASQYRVPAHVLHVIEAPRPARQSLTGSSSETALAEVQARAMGMSEPVEICVAHDVVSAVSSTARANDLIAMGAPNYWRMASHFDGSIPDMIAQRLPNPLLMLVGRKSSNIRLKDIFWPQMIRLGLDPDSKEDAIATLVQTLVAHDQVPYAWRDLLFDRAIARERLMSTGVGSETAFPHIIIEDFIGVVGCMGIVPRGVDFDAHRGRNTRFVFLLVTPEDFYDEYLVVLSEIAKRMILPALRRELLACKTPADVLNVLDPDDS